MKSFFILIISLFFSLIVFGQADKQSILKYFKGIDYYPDSIVHCAYNTKKGMKNGYAIEFDSLGRDAAIGQYKKNGNWHYSFGMRTYYKNGVSEGVSALSPEGNGEIWFKELYHKILHLPF